MDDFKKLTEQLFKIYSNSKSVDDLEIENYFDENISIIGTGVHEIYGNLQEFRDSFKFDVKQRGKIRIDTRIRDLQLSIDGQGKSGWSSICINQFLIRNKWTVKNSLFHWESR